MAYCIIIETLNKMETDVYHLWGTIGEPRRHWLRACNQSGYRYSL